MTAAPHRVEVFPVASDRWIAVIDTDRGPFSTEVDSADRVQDEVAVALEKRLGAARPFALFDENGHPWNSAAAARQLRALCRGRTSAPRA